MGLPGIMGLAAQQTARGGGAAAPRALVEILMGQSLNAPRNTISVASTDSGKMPVGNTAIEDWDFFSTNATWTGNWDEVASLANYAEAIEQTPGVGMIDVLKEDFEQIYVGNAAIGARALNVLNTGGPVDNLKALIFRLVELAVADGYDRANIDVAFYSAHGEADIAASTSEAGYLALGTAYYKQAQAWAAQALQLPAYRAPVVLDLPASGTLTSGTSEAVKKAIYSITQALDNGVFMGGKYQWECEADRTHQVADAYVQRGEYAAHLQRQHFRNVVIDEGLRITNVTWDGATEFVATFNANIVRDASFENFGTSFTGAPDGFEWFDNGVAVTINNLVYSGNTVTGTLNSTPSGTLAQQELRIASQTHSGTLLAWPENIAGSLVRADQAGWASPNFPAYTNYRWASPQIFDSVEAA